MADFPLFFPDRTQFRAWMHSQPGTHFCKPFRTSDLSVRPLARLQPPEEDEPEVEGPYFLSPRFLALRVDHPYYVLMRVGSEQEADVRWYVPRPGQQGEVMYAACVTETEGARIQRIAALTIFEAKRRLEIVLALQGRTL